MKTLKIIFLILTFVSISLSQNKHDLRGIAGTVNAFTKLSRQRYFFTEMN